LEKENIFFPKEKKIEKAENNFLWRRRRLERERRKIFGEGKCYHSGTTNEQRTRKDRATKTMDHGRLR